MPGDEADFSSAFALAKKDNSVPLSANQHSPHRDDQDSR